ncbi:MAG: D-alanyl-D-alanine carboxypeptidase/D-alanyl-D-alanine-endopeptidase [Bacteroidota bacterium]|nr:D-alanyl-D-alanine carboxypeptidase/D-alanyl-D-alanine-endopeptidase [Bacteroidota bacterium]MDP4229995.1 D-alanyl-D-alanine carboxypeptidase/D-alanyl-D-alanine-endopeptidase [Bacteroidota bacterium]MDP4235222.1 D-alanyl-D-alanine carboxypeptidase/D-alanyl-D-alanine-endopeptidase [Bacteroidota bacterium]
MKTLFGRLSVRDRYCKGLVYAIFVLFSSVLLETELLAQPQTAPIQSKSPQELEAIQKLQHGIEADVNDPRFAHSFVGIEIKSVKTGESLFHQNEGKNFLPASNLKLFTTATALGLLGTDYRYTTQLVTDGEIHRSVLKGNLIIRGSGDPTLGSPSMYPDKDPGSVFNAWADSLERMGIEKIDGSIICDPDCFTDEAYPEGWAVEDMPFYFATVSSGLSFADNAVGVSVTPGLHSGSKALYETSPETDYFSVDNTATTHEPKVADRSKGKDSSNTTAYLPTNSIKVTRSSGENTISITGTIDRGSPGVHEQLSVENPSMYAATVFREILEYRGFTITGGTMAASELDDKVDYSEAQTLARSISPPMSEIVKVLNKKSQNFYSEQLIRTIGKEIMGKGNWESGITAEKRYLSFLGLDVDRIALHDGSGLSRMDLVSPQDVVMLLRSVQRQPKIFPAFDSSLPVMGVDGTLSERLKGSGAMNNVHAKTGFLTGIRCLSGYVRTKDDEMLAFSFMVNNYTIPTKEINELQDQLILLLVNFSRK